MQLSQAILLDVLRCQIAAARELPTDAELGALARDASFAMLERIKAIIDDDGLDDAGCMEAIVWVFEEMGFALPGRRPPG